MTFGRHCEQRSDEAVQAVAATWIASLRSPIYAEESEDRTVDQHQEAELTAGTKIVPGERYGFFTDTTLCMGQGLRGRLQAVEPASRRQLHSPATSYDNTSALSGSSWRHVKFIEQSRPKPVSRYVGDPELADDERRLQALRRRRLPGGLPHRRDYL